MSFLGSELALSELQAEVANESKLSSVRSERKYRKEYILSLSLKLLLAFTTCSGLILSLVLCFIIKRLDVSTRTGAFNLQPQIGPPESIQFNQDVQAETIIAHDQLTLKRVLADRLELSGPFRGGYQAGVKMLFDYDTVSMQARSYNSDSLVQKPYSFRPSKQINNLDIARGLVNVRSIRAPLHVGLSSQVNTADDLDISSPSKLELSGNLGLRAHSDSLSLDCRQNIEIQPKDGVISISAKEGLLLPAISLAGDSSPASDSMLMISSLKSYPMGQNVYSLCFDPNVGEVFQAAGSCD